MKRFFVILITLSLLVTLIVPTYAVGINKDGYIINYDNADTGTIFKEDNGYLYVSSVHDFYFEAYYLENYAPCQGMLILQSNEDKVLFAAIDMLANNLTYVWKNGNIINQYKVEIDDYLYSEYNLSLGIENEFCYRVLKLEENYDLYATLARTNTWFTGYTEENANPLCVSEEVCLEETGTASRAATTINFVGSDQAVNAAINTVGFLFREKYLYTVGFYSGKAKNTDGEVIAAYVVENYYDDVFDTYVSMIATWRVSLDVMQSIDKSCLQAIGSFQKDYNMFVEYDPNTNTAQVMLAGDSASYVITRDFATMFRLYGEHNYAYFGEYAFEVYGGGASNGSSNNLLTTVAGQILGARVPLYSTVSVLTVYIKEALTDLQNYNYNSAKRAYEITNNSTVNYVKSIAATYDSTLYKRYSMLTTRAIIYNYPSTLGDMYYQVEFDVFCINNSDIKHPVRITASECVEFDR